MSGFLNILGKLFGNKYDKDVKAITPIVDKINEQYQSLNTFTNDELRGKTIELKSQINDFVSDERNQIDTLKKKSNLKGTLAEEKEILYKEIDDLEKVVLEKIEEIFQQQTCKNTQQTI